MRQNIPTVLHLWSSLDAELSIRMHAIAFRIWKGRVGRRDAGALREIVRRSPYEPVPHELLGELLLGQEKFREAAASLEAALRLDPANPRLRARLETARNPDLP